MAFRLHHKDDYIEGEFQAMASPCYILLDTKDPLIANPLVNMVEQEARRIEHKLSRYRDDNIIYTINHAHGQTIHVDDETARLLDYADLCFELSDGLFDITSGVLRRIWRFDGGDNIATEHEVKTLRPLIGWQKVRWQNPEIQLPEGMEIDLGGIGKEYAVDRVATRLAQHTKLSFVVSFGGDMFVRSLRHNGQAWRVGIENPKEKTDQVAFIQIQQGGIATSGDSRRFLLKNGQRYSHILNPKTGYPVQDAPHSVTVLSNTCTEAGMLATFASLQGAQAKAFLEAQQVSYWLY